MKYQPLIIGFLSIGTLSLPMSTAQAATLTHQYGLNNTLTDSFGGSSLVANGGTLAPGAQLPNDRFVSVLGFVPQPNLQMV